MMIPTNHNDQDYHQINHRNKMKPRPPTNKLAPTKLVALRGTSRNLASDGSNYEIVLFKIFPLIMATFVLISSTNIITPSSSSSSPMPPQSSTNYNSNKNNVIYNNGFQLYADQTTGNETSESQATGGSGGGSMLSCLNGLLTFELSTGFIYKPASAETLAMMPSTLQLTDCLDYCLQNASCLAINFEMGLCVLLSSSAKQNPQNLYSSQFPVFTIYAEKKCLLQGDSQAIKQKHRCQRAWTFERVAGYEMKTRPRRKLKLASKEHCMEACLLERDFECRSANWYRQTNECTLSDQDRHSVSQSEAGDQQIKANLNELYGPSNLTSPVRPSMPARPTPPPGLYQNYYLPTGDRLRNIPSLMGPHPNDEAGQVQATNVSTSNTTTTSGQDSNKRGGREMVDRSAAAATGGSAGLKQEQTGPSNNKYRHIRQLFSELQRMRGQLQQGIGSTSINTNQATSQQQLRATSGAKSSSTTTTTTTLAPNELASLNSISGSSPDMGGWPPSQYVVVELQSLAPVDYLENNCVYEPNKLCEFRKIQNRVLKTVDSIYQDINSLEECKQKCLQAPYRCYSFDYGDTSERVCRTSHLDQASLLSVKEPYLDVVGAITYELASCFNVSIQCRAREMVAQVSSSKMFRGKIYVKSRPQRCLNDVKESLQFELTMRYHDENCDVRATSTSQQGVFSNDIVIQHHDRIVTTQDVGLSVYCQYDLGNRSITNNVDLAIDRIDEAPMESKNGGQQMGAGRPHNLNASPGNPLEGGGGGGGSFNSPLTITSLATTVVKSPNVTMRITNMNGQPVASAMVGDRLALLFEIKEKTSPFGIFVREIIAMDGKQLLAAAAAAASAATSNNNGQRISGGDGGSGGSYHYGPANNNNNNNRTMPPLNEKTIESMFQANKANSVQFIDSDGCPTDANIMGPLIRMDPAGHRVLAPFDAFKFPTSDMVFFRAVVTSCVSECRPVVCSSTSAGPLEALNYITTTTAASPPSSPTSSSYLSSSTTTTMTTLATQSLAMEATNRLDLQGDNGMGRNMQPSSHIYHHPKPSSYAAQLPELRATTPPPENGGASRPPQWPAAPSVPGGPHESPSRGNKLGPAQLVSQLAATEQQQQRQQQVVSASELHGTTPAVGGSGDSLTTIPGFPGGFPEQTWRQQQQQPSLATTETSISPQQQQQQPGASASNNNNIINHHQTNSSSGSTKISSPPGSAADAADAAGSPTTQPPQVAANQEREANANNGDTGNNNSNNPSPTINLDAALSPQQKQQIVKLFETKLRQQLAGAAPTNSNANSNSNNNGDISKSMADLYTGFLTSIMFGNGGSSNSGNNPDGGFKGRLHGGETSHKNGEQQQLTGGRQSLADFESLDSNSVIANNNEPPPPAYQSFGSSGNSSKDEPLKRMPVADLEGGQPEAAWPAEPQAQSKPINGQSLKQQDQQQQQEQHDHLPVYPMTKPQSILEQEAGAANGMLQLAKGGSGDAAAAASISHDPDDTEQPIDSASMAAVAAASLESHYNDLSIVVPPTTSNGQGQGQGQGQQAQQTFDREPAAAAAAASLPTTATTTITTKAPPASYPYLKYWRQQQTELAMASSAASPNGSQQKPLLPMSGINTNGSDALANNLSPSTTKQIVNMLAGTTETAPQVAGSNTADQARNRKQRDKQQFADSYLGAFQSYGKRRRRRQADADEEEAILAGRPDLYVFIREPQAATYLAPSRANQTNHLGHNEEHEELPRFTSGFIEMYRASEGPPKSRRKREAQPSYDMEELVVQSIKIMDRLQFQDDDDDDDDDDNDHDGPSRPPANKAQRAPTQRGGQNLPKSQLVTRSQLATGNHTRQSAPAFGPYSSSGHDEASAGDAAAAAVTDSGRPATSGWSSSGALGLLILASSFIFVQIFLVLVCLIEYNQRRQRRRRAATLVATRNLHLQRHQSLQDPNCLSRCGSVSTLSSSNTLFLGSTLTSAAAATAISSSSSPKAAPAPLNDHHLLLPTYSVGNLYHNDSNNTDNQISAATSSLGGGLHPASRTLGRKDIEYPVSINSGRQNKGTSSYASSRDQCLPSTWGLLASNNETTRQVDHGTAAAARCIACRLPNSTKGRHHHHL